MKKIFTRMASGAADTFRTVFFKPRGIILNAQIDDVFQSDESPALKRYDICEIHYGANIWKIRQLSHERGPDGVFADKQDGVIGENLSPDQVYLSLLDRLDPPELERLRDFLQEVMNPEQRRLVNHWLLTHRVPRAKMACHF
ncbi:MAG: hypothetical protein H6865_07805 [Rhodospirillales bacterium]|nr:hypothetical protein [Alphaproteobacteria bacterium]MCB9987519.1 hypothetical protein [Rhodospirillales bacterium]USO07507.1 MAG: hypothetical protein H6866_08850 [Rhodospirillales bacterium]